VAEHPLSNASEAKPRFFKNHCTYTINNITNNKQQVHRNIL